MSLFNFVGIFFLRHSEEVSVYLFNFSVCGLAEKDEDVIALGEFSCLDRQRSEHPIFAESDFVDPAPEISRVCPARLTGFPGNLVAVEGLAVQF